MTVKRLFDIFLSLVILTSLLPFFIVISLIIKFSSKGPVFYLSDRAGLNGVVFKLIKFRTMKVGSDKESSISALNDDRVSLVGDLLRKTKIDELPQFVNVLFGEMAIVGPRPESQYIVYHFYNNKLYKNTLSVRPGMTSPGSLYNYTHAHQFLDENDPEGSYVRKFLPIKLALETVYINNQSLWYDLGIIIRTIIVIIKITLGQKSFDNPSEYDNAVKNGLIQEES